jgi:hypothetical protein
MNMHAGAACGEVETCSAMAASEHAGLNITTQDKLNAGCLLTTAPSRIYLARHKEASQPFDAALSSGGCNLNPQ